MLNPSTSVAAARANLAQARAVFEALVGAELGYQQWRAAHAALDALPLDYLTIDPKGFLLAGDKKANAWPLVAAVTPCDGAILAKRRVADIEDFGGFDGEFSLPGAFQKHERSAEDAKTHLALLSRLNTCNLAITEDSYETLPLDLDSLYPPDAFWENTALLESVAQQLSVSHGNLDFRDGKRHYSTSLTNLSSRRIRVKVFGNFEKT